MKILLTGGSGDVGTLLTPELFARGHDVANIDLAAPKIDGTHFFQGSITDRTLLNKAMQGVDCVIHIAAWHGIHEPVRSPAEFHDLNVTGTFNVLQTAAAAGSGRFIFISSTSVDDRYGIYGHTKILGEEMVAAYAARIPACQYITLRPRAFVPPWNTAVYKDFSEWANWFMKGAVHIDDFRDAILIALALKTDRLAPVYTIDGAYEYTAADLENWDDQTMARYYPDDMDLARQYGLNIARKPKVLNIPPDQQLPGYQPRYSQKTLFRELRDFGLTGPPAPFGAVSG